LERLELCEGFFLDGISHIVIEVADLKSAEEFYRDILGFELTDGCGAADCGASVLLRAGSDQWLILSQSTEPRSLPETGVHQAYRVTHRDRETINRKLAARHHAVHDYKEDRPAEENDNFYFHDLDGNRIQMVVSADSDGSGKVLGIDHAAVECHDLEWAEDFYVNVLGLEVEHRVGWRTADYVRAQLWGEGKEYMAPGTRRWDQRYTVMEQKRRIPRPNTHFFLRVGTSVLGIYLATVHRQEPPEEQIVGTPRIGLRTDRSKFDEGLKRLSDRRSPVHGPVQQAASSPIALSAYLKDPGGNFLEICVPRDTANG
jgi:catechol 2,3-dioxygenase-like lactoylglutathione lyase family enzyme